MNPYQTPRANLDQPANERAAAPVVIAAFLVGMGLHFTLQTISGVVLSWVFVGSGTAVENLYAAMVDSTAFNLWSHTISLGALVATGVLVAWLKPANAIPTAACTGGLMTAFVLLQFLVPYSYGLPFWSQVLSLAKPIPAVIAGAWFWSQRAATA